MKLAFLGTPGCAVPALEALIGAGHSVGLVITRPDRPSGRSRVPLPPPVKQAAHARGIDVFQPTKVRDAAFRERLLESGPELLVVVAYGRILPPPVLDATPYGAINVHFSLLPALRGAAPVQWALVHGHRVTGVTTMQMSEGMDEGDVLLQRRVEIAAGEHAPALQRRLAGVGADLLLETLDGLRDGRLTPTPQDAAQATSAPLLRREDGEISLDLSAPQIEGRIRGFDPWPGVWVASRGRRLRLVEGRTLEDWSDTGDAPGTVVAMAEDGAVLACGAGTGLLLARVQPEGRRAMPARDALNGRLLTVGERLAPLGDPS